jgi:four helix bundle protein
MENKGRREDPLRELSLEFAERVVATARRVREEHKEFSLADQLLRSGTSIGANLSEAVYAASRSDFLNKNKIALKECSETLYWIQLLQRCGLIPKEDARPLWKTCDQLRRMIASACKTIETTK